VPAFRRLSLARPLAPQVDGLHYPVVVKPLALSGSRGVIRADNPSELGFACERVRAILADLPDPEERDHVLVEAFVPGIEVALEGMLVDGRLAVLALFDKPEPLEGPYFEETYYILPSRLSDELQRRVRVRVEEACRAFGLREGPVHAEARLSAGDAWVIEVAARTIGGQCARLLRFGTGRGLEDLVLAEAVGSPLPLERDDQAGGVLMIPIPAAGILRRVEGVLAARRVPYVEDVEISIREGYRLVPLPEASSYLGFIFARAPRPGDAERALRDAHSLLRVVVAPFIPLTPAAGDGTPASPSPAARLG
jgi:biotin carboxylase